MPSKNLINVGSVNGFSPVKHKAITWTNADVFSFGSQRTNIGKIEIKMKKV